MNIFYCDYEDDRTCRAWKLLLGASATAVVFSPELGTKPASWKPAINDGDVLVAHRLTGEANAALASLVNNKSHVIRIAGGSGKGLLPDGSYERKRAVTNSEENNRTDPHFKICFAQFVAKLEKTGTADWDLLEGPASDILLGQLLPFGVLLDGFLAVSPKEAGPWFKLAAVTDETRETEGAGQLTDESFWKELQQYGSAVERIKELLVKQEHPAKGFDKVLRRAAALKWVMVSSENGTPIATEANAKKLYEAACLAVEQAWRALCADGMKGAPRDSTDLRTLVETASVGFQVLAAGHL
jgi:hypothetical protein